MKRGAIWLDMLDRLTEILGCVYPQGAAHLLWKGGA